MPGIYVHLGSLHLDFSSKFASYSSAISSCESNIHSSQHIETHSAGTMERIYTMNPVLRGENNTSMKGQRKSFFQTVWDRYIGRNFSRIPTIFSSKMNPLSVTLVNDEILMPEFIEKSDIQEEKSIDIRHMSKVILETMQSPTTVVPFIRNCPNTLSDFECYFGNDFNKMEQQIIKQDNKDITIENLIYNMMNFNITCKDKSTMESHSVSNIRETKDLNNINNKSCSTEIDLQNRTDTDKDTLDMDKNPASNDVNVIEDAKTFLIVSHSDVPELVKPVKKTPISARLSVMCRNAWNSLTTRFYCRTNSVQSEKCVKRSSYLLKRHRRRRANAIAMGRGRGRERCQLRRSGVSQTRHRKELTRRNLAMIIELDCKIFRNDEIQYYGIQNDHSLNDESDNLDDMDGYDVPDGALLVKRISPVIFNFSDATPTKRKPQTPEDQEIIKDPTRVRYVIDPSIKSNIDHKTKTFNIEENLESQSVNSVDSEDSFVVFAASDNEAPKREAVEYSTEMHYINSIKINENNSEMYDTHDNSFRSRLLSECSVDSEDSFIIFRDIGNESPKKQETMKYSTRVRYVVDPLTKINSSYRKDYNSETYNVLKDTLRPRLLSESSSADSEDSFIVFEGSDDESPKQDATEDSIYDISDSSTEINNDHCKNYNKRYMHEDLFQFSESAEDTDDSFCIVFNSELEQNCATDNCANVNCIKTDMSTSMQDNSIEDETMIENNKDSEKSTVQTKKVSFASTPIVHIMVTWNYAYRAARKGQWEEMARDNERFKGRINSIAAVLNPILTSKHRSKVWQERFTFQE
ncbi:uncharacterized protein LOC126858308 [Cataglyphis hispanica]|uniref:uncharacterized protein LOC126858308 n=1 Tax=Cataglyphis hispanica TaxID=1086592 RepID=UPI002180370D|nr:uncharacterized protein LOC126858308 [Cataglyphis hispanica]